MIDLKKISDEAFLSSYKENLKNRKADVHALDEVLTLEAQRKELTSEFETQRAEQNRVSQEVGRLKSKGEDASAIIAEMQILSQQVKEAGKKLEVVKEQLLKKASGLPNMSHASVPVGQSEEDNKIEKVWGEIKNFSFKAKEHWELGEALGFIDFERAGKVTGSRFAFLRGGAARLERALIQFMMDTHAKDGYEEIIPPFMANSKSFFGTGQFPKFIEDVFHVDGTDYYLAPTAEVPVTNFYANETLDGAKLPQSFTAYSPCFRSEAGSYGKDTKGLIRQHQFNKVELLKWTHPEASYEEHEGLTRQAEKILELLELPYRRSTLCSGDISFGAAKCYDLEVWLPGQEAYREISSCSNFEDFQARRANIRFKDGAKGKPQYVHTLNGSGLAVGRTLVAILENYQTEDGKIKIPTVLKPYFFNADYL